MIEDLATTVACGGFAFGGILGDALQQFGGAEAAVAGGFEFGGESGIGSSPGGKGFVPLGMSGGAFDG